MVNELVVNHRKTSLCLGFSSFLFVDTSIWGIRSEIINVASKALLLSSLFSSHSAFTQQSCYIGLFKVPWKCCLLSYLRAIIIDVSSFWNVHYQPFHLDNSYLKCYFLREAILILQTLLNTLIRWSLDILYFPFSALILTIIYSYCLSIYLICFSF